LTTGGGGLPTGVDGDRGGGNWGGGREHLLEWGGKGGVGWWRQTHKETSGGGRVYKEKRGPAVGENAGAPKKRKQQATPRRVGRAASPALAKHATAAAAVAAKGTDAPSMPSAPASTHAPHPARSPPPPPPPTPPPKGGGSQGGGPRVVRRPVGNRRRGGGGARQQLGGAGGRPGRGWRQGGGGRVGPPRVGVGGAAGGAWRARGSGRCWRGPSRLVSFFFVFFLSLYSVSCPCLFCVDIERLFFVDVERWPGTPASSGGALLCVQSGRFHPRCSV